MLVAPGLAPAEDTAIRRMAADGMAAADIARRTGRPAGEVVVRLVELELGPLGRVAPAPDAAGRAAKQAPMLRLAARAFGGGLQRLGDRLYLNGVETDLPAVVRLARERGEAIRYPGVDPMPAAFGGGPSLKRPRGRRRGSGTIPGLRL